VAVTTLAMTLLLPILQFVIFWSPVAWVPLF
jgi:hypothetical protein